MQKFAGECCLGEAANCSTNSLIKARGINFSYSSAENTLVSATLKLLMRSCAVWASACMSSAQELVPQGVQSEQQQCRRFFGWCTDNALVKTDHTAACQRLDPSRLLG